MVNDMEFIGPFPDPVHGQSLATKNLYDYLLKNGVDVSAYDTSGDTVYLRLWRHLRSALSLPFGKGEFYISLNANKGAILTLLIVAVGVLFRRRPILHHHTYGHINSWRLVGFLVSKLVDYFGINVVLGSSMGSKLKSVYGLNNNPFVLKNTGLVNAHLLEVEKKTHSSKAAVLGYISNITIEKGVEEILALCSLLDKSELSFELLIAGPCKDIRSQKVLDDIMKDYPSNVRYLGALDEYQKINFFTDIDVLLFPTLYENEAAPLVILEALASSVPCISYDRGCISDDVGDLGGVVVSIDNDFSYSVKCFLEEYLVDPMIYNNSARENFIQLHDNFDKSCRSLFKY